MTRAVWRSALARPFGCLTWALVLHGRITSDDTDAGAHAVEREATGVGV
jgi:hypothetical protein